MLKEGYQIKDKDTGGSELLGAWGDAKLERRVSAGGEGQGENAGAGRGRDQIGTRLSEFVEIEPKPTEY